MSLKFILLVLELLFTNVHQIVRNVLMMFLLELQEAIALHVKLDLNFQEFFALKIVETARNMELKLVMTGLTMGKDALLDVKALIHFINAM